MDDVQFSPVSIIDDDLMLDPAAIPGPPEPPQLLNETHLVALRQFQEQEQLIYKGDQKAKTPLQPVGAVPPAVEIIANCRSQSAVMSHNSDTSLLKIPRATLKFWSP